MAITLTLKPEIEARLIARAKAEGMSIEELLESTVNWLLSSSESHPDLPRSSEEKAQQFLQWVENHVTQAPPLSDEAVGRESIYRDRLDAQL